MLINQNKCVEKPLKNVFCRSGKQRQARRKNSTIKQRKNTKRAEEQLPAPGSKACNKISQLFVFFFFFLKSWCRKMAKFVIFSSTFHPLGRVKSLEAKRTIRKGSLPEQTRTRSGEETTALRAESSSRPARRVHQTLTTRASPRGRR